MKRILLILIALNIGFAKGQTTMTSYDEVNPRWFFDANIGATWQTSDVKAYPGMGFGFGLGNYFYKKPGRALSFAWRFRYLHGVMFGMGEQRSYGLENNTTLNGTTSAALNYRDSLGYVFQNYRMEINRYSLELMISFNRLRERTGIVLNLFGGVGLTQHWNWTDQLDANGNRYDYSLLDSTGTTLADLNTLRGVSSFRDLDYESNSDAYTGSKTVFMPSLGIELGYQFGNWFAMGVGHKVTFALNDNIDGYRFNDDNTPQGKNDMYHYSHVFFRWFLGKGKHHRDDNSNNNNNTNNNNYNNNTTNNNNNNTNNNNNSNNNNSNNNNNNVSNNNNTANVRPVVHFTSPAGCPAMVQAPGYQVRASVYYIDFPNQIVFKVNGDIVSGFSYSSSTQQFIAPPIVLQPGDNIIEIKATNNVGSDYQSCVINYQTTISNNNNNNNNNQNQVPPPVITITNPAANPYTTYSSSVNVTSTILNIGSSSQINYTVNGVSNPGFFFNPANGSFSSAVNLNEGYNVVEITATNIAGQDKEVLTINYQKPVTVQPPIVTIYNPNINPYTVSTNSATVNATVQNVASATNINVTVNGVNYTGFSFNPVTQQLSLTTSLSPGANIVQVTGTNAVGSDSKYTTIIYQEPVNNLPPVVTFVDPNINPYTTSSATKPVKAIVQNVSASSQIAVTVNGSTVTGFSFISTTGEVNFTANLVAGANVVEIKGTNPYGSDSKSTIIIYEKPSSPISLPPVVAINYPLSNPYNTTSSTETVTATVLRVNSAADIAVTINGALTTAFTYNTTTHLVNIPVNLVIGNNVITITGTNTAGSDTKSTTIVYNPPCDKPIVQNINPVTNTITSTGSTLNFAAHVSNVTNSSQISFVVNGVTQVFGFDAATGMVNATINLNNGINNITLTATNNCGNATGTYAVTYTKPLLPPVVTFVQPAVNPASVSAAAYVINATVSHVNSTAGITFKVNGVTSTGFIFNPASGAFSSAVTLNAGTNIFEITGTNADGTDSKSTVIVYTEVAPPCEPPVVAFNNPPGTIYTTSSPVLNMIATVTNSTSTQVVVKYNGSVVSHTLTGTNLTANINLSEGTYPLEISVNNGCKQVIQTSNINYKRTPEPPVVTITSPGSNPYNSSSANITILAKIYKVSSAANVTFKVNGVTGAPFTYNPLTNDFSATYVMTTPNTSFQVTGTNADGSDSKTVVVNYTLASDLCPKPLITWTSAPSGGTVNVAAFSLGAKVINVPSQSNINVTLNGLVVPFAYLATTGKMTTGVTLQPGVNVITVTANNNCGTVTETYQVTYLKPKQPPVINITKPAVNPYLTTSASNVVEATITNISNISEVSCTVNGVPNTSFSFAVATGKFILPVVLTPGMTTVTINAVNADGSDSKSTVLQYKPMSACIPPMITVPVLNTKDKFVATATQTYDVTVTAVISPSQVSVKHNGTDIPFTLAGSNVKFTVTLVNGVNTFVIKATNNCGSDEKTFTVTYTRPLLRPVVNITKPVAAGTSVVSPSFAFEATLQHVSSSSQINMTFNGAPFTGFTYNSATGVLTAPLTLVTGTNSVQVSASTPDGNASDNTTIIYMVTAPPCKVPVITIPATLNNSTVSTANITITATVSNVTSASQVSIKQNGTTVVPFTISGGTVIANVTLIPGSNQFRIHAENECGKADQLITINYKQILQPTVTITLPATDGTTVLTPAYGFQAFLQNVTSAGQITMTFNGTNYTGFTYDPVTGKLNTALTLVSGTNTVVVSVTTPGGSASDNTTIIYTSASPNCKPPVITFAAAQGSTVSDKKYTFQATVTNVTSSQVTVKHNATNIPFTLSGTNLTAMVSLVPGKNQFTVVAGNECGKTEQVLVINYFPPVIPPVVTITNPPTSGTTVTNPSFNFTATVLNVTSSSQISLTLNGTAITSFTYNSMTHVLTSTLPLHIGSNTVVVSASTPDGSDSKSTVINYQAPCNGPVVTSQQTNCTVSSASFTINFTVLNATPDKVVVKVNGVSVPFTMVGHNLTAMVTLSLGPNTIQVLANNDCGSDDNSLVATYTCLSPTIQMPPSSSGYINSTGSSYNFNATVNYATASQVTFQLNGANYPFTMSGYTLNSNLNLINGDNVVTINATNTCGSTKASVIVKYNPAPTLMPPVITITNPASGSANVTNPNFILNGTVTNITTSSQLEVKVNGTSISSFIYTPSTKMLSVPAVLVNGNNTIHIKATNAAGTDVKTAAINYDDPSMKTMVTICHYPPGNTDNPQTLSIPMSAWSAHQAHGDILGGCPQKAPDKITPRSTGNNNGNNNGGTNTNSTQQMQQKQSANEQEYNNAMQRGNQALANKNYAAAKAEYQKALTYKPGDSTATGKLKEADDAQKAANTPKVEQKIEPAKVEQKTGDDKSRFNRIQPTKTTTVPNP